MCSCPLHRRPVYHPAFEYRLSDDETARRLHAMSGTDTGSLASLVRERRNEILRLVREHRGRTISVFGSVARGDAHGGSDIDFLVEFEPDSSLLDLIHLEEALHGLLGVPVDVISVGALLDRDGRIRRDAVPL
jgi:uncharacterized protein